MFRRRFIPPENSFARSLARSLRPIVSSTSVLLRDNSSFDIPYRRPKNLRFSAAVRSG